MNIRFWVFWVVCSILGVVEPCAAINESLPVPTVDEHSNFLLEQWKPNAPVVTVFTDPFCPYCIQALKRRDELKPYNVFLYWYPIFGERSDKRVAELFQCTSPVSAQVINSVIEGKSPGCQGQRNEKLVALNRKMYEAYSPPGVPSYYMGGVKVSVAELKAWHKTVSAVAPSVQLDWPRYNKNRLDVHGGSLSKIVILLPLAYTKSEKLISVLKTRPEFDWYLLYDGSEDVYKSKCDYLVGKCEVESLKQYTFTTQEIKLLYDLTSINTPVLIMNGKILSDIEKIKYCSFLKDFL